MSSILRAGLPARPGVILLPTGPLASWAAEFITAAARQQPPTPPLNNWVSHPGIPGVPAAAMLRQRAWSFK